MARLAALLPLAYPFLVHLAFSWLGASGLGSGRRLFLLVPVAVNAVAFWVFARTLRRGPSMIETLARLQDPVLPEGGVEHCRRVTIAWCALFVVNGGIALGLALWGTLAQWTLFTGVISTVLIGALLGGEILYRAWRFPGTVPLLRGRRRLAPPTPRS